MMNNKYRDIYIKQVGNIKFESHPSNKTGKGISKELTLKVELRLPKYMWDNLNEFIIDVDYKLSPIQKIIEEGVTTKDFYLGDEPRNSTHGLLQDFVVPDITKLRNEYMTTGDYRCVKEIRRILPESYMVVGDLYTDYQQLKDIYIQRGRYNQDEEWMLINEFIEDLPFSEEYITGIERGDNCEG